jgi:hypothetical protein
MPDTDPSNYEYYKYVKTPSQMGIESGDSLYNVAAGVGGLFSYVKLLVEGDSTASTTGKPLGNKYFLLTEQDCTDTANNKTVKRSLYFDNVPTGNLGMFADTGSESTDFRGLIPGAVEDVMSIGKIDFFSAFSNFNVPKCQSVTLKTIDVNNNAGTETQFVTISDIKEISPCNFSSRVNPQTNAVCTRQGFTMSRDGEDDDHDDGDDIKGAELYKDYYKLNNDNNDVTNINTKLMMPDDVFLKVLFYSFGALSVYIALKLMGNIYKKRD